ncbi:single-stranded DNA-binding protein [bacterium]|jgi:single-strand DNA-binding protein|nr:single-stranded DNA-binding protein [bacterium]
MSCNYNQATLAGRLTKNPELKKISDSTSKLSFVLAVNRGYKNETGQTEADFIPISLWGKMAEIGHDLLEKGSPVLVWGKIKVRSYEVGEERKWATEISADNFQLLNRKKIEILNTSEKEPSIETK